MLVDSGSFFYSLCFAWLVALLLGKNNAGEGSRVPLVWHPASWLCEGIALGRNGGKFWAGVGCCLFGAFLGSRGLIGGVFGLFILAPIPYLLLDHSRRDSRVRQIRRIFYNPLRAVTSQPAKELSNGRVEETVMKLYFCIDDVDWGTLTQVMGEPVRHFLERRRVAGPIFAGDADNDFLQVYDSLGLSRFLVEPSNDKAMKTIISLIGGESAETSRDPEREDPERLDERIVTAGATLGVDAGYAKSQKKQMPTGKARAVPLAPPSDLGGGSDGED